MSSRKINIVLSGPGLIGQKHVHLISENPNAQLLSIVAPSNLVILGFLDHPTFVLTG